MTYPPTPSALSWKNTRTLRRGRGLGLERSERLLLASTSCVEARSLILLATGYIYLHGCPHKLAQAGIEPVIVGLETRVVIIQVS